MMKALVIVPVLNEAHRLGAVLDGLLEHKEVLDVVAIDGHSTDGTVALLEKYAAQHPEINWISQADGEGYGGALKSGFRYALQHDYDPIITMDGDGSHGPEYIRDFLEKSRVYDLVIGSRYIDGVRVEGWRFRKLLVSKLASMYVSYLLVKPIWDFTSGFRCYRRKIIENIDIDGLHATAYIVQIQLLHFTYHHRQRVKEIPFIYRDTLDNVSKVSAQSKWATFFYVLRYRAPLLEILRHLVYLKKEYERFVEEYDELINPPVLRSFDKENTGGALRLSVGVMAYNEEKIIRRCLEGLQNQQLGAHKLEQIVVVSSGSTDATNAIVEEMAREDSRIELIVQPRRMGKASAINEYLAVARGDIAMIESADTITYPDTLRHLVAPFRDAHVGMCGVHPMPVNEKKSFVGYAVHKLWELHHYMALDNPKCGEMVAFRNIVPRIPKYTAVDEAAIEGMFVRDGYKLAYAPEALLQNKGPENLRDFVKQRRRIASGHRHLAASMGHAVYTQKPGNILKYIRRSQQWTPKAMLYTFLLMALEAYARFMGFIDFYLRDKNPFIWDISQSTKNINNS
ncbi:MAG: glycosyltransferase [Calditrichaeota bacterium]|nr:MAG: glycosyltransferase [Calditrichota bacterium]